MPLNFLSYVLLASESAKSESEKHSRIIAEIIGWILRTLETIGFTKLFLLLENWPSTLLKSLYNPQPKIFVVIFTYDCEYYCGRIAFWRN